MKGYFSSIEGLASYMLWLKKKKVNNSTLKSYKCICAYIHIYIQTDIHNIYSDILMTIKSLLEITC